MGIPVRNLMPLDLRGVPFKRNPARAVSSAARHTLGGSLRDASACPIQVDSGCGVFSIQLGKTPSTGLSMEVQVSELPFPRRDGQPNTTMYTASRIGMSHATARPSSELIRAMDSHPDIFDFDVSEWVFRPHHHDIAISPPLMLDPDIDQAEAMGLGSLLTKEEEIKDDINAAEDVFMVGRFIDYEGTETNVPACRFGNVSMMNAKVKQPTKYRGRSIVVDMHSRTGFSGSPVFVYRTSGSGFSPNIDLMISWHDIKMIGIHWGQFREEYAFEEITIWRRIWRRLFPSKTASAAAKSLITKGMYARGLSGMSCVVPAQAILSLMNSPELQAMREAEEIRLEPAMARRSLQPQATQAGPPKFEPPKKTPEEVANEWIEQARGKSRG